MMQSSNQTSLKGIDVLIISCGDIGQRLARLLIDQGANVSGLRRNTAQLAEGIHAISADITEPQSLSCLEGLEPDYIVVTNSAGKATEAQYQAIYLQGLANVLAKVKPKRRLFIASSTSVYGQDDSGWVDENSITQAKGYSGRIQLEAEALAREQFVDTTVVRFAGIYGPGRERLINQVKDGMHSPQIPEHYTNRIHVEDCAGIFNFLIQQDLAGSELAPRYIGVDDTPVTMFEVKEWIASELGLVEHWQTCAPPTARGGSKRCSNALIKAQGYQFKYATYQQGYGEIIAALDR